MDPPLSRHEPVADAGFRPQIFRPCRIGFQLEPQLPHIDTHVVGLITAMRSPYFVEQLAMREHLVCVSSKYLKKFVFGSSQPHFFSLTQYTPLRKIDLKIAGAKYA